MVRGRALVAEAAVSEKFWQGKEEQGGQCDRSTCVSRGGVREKVREITEDTSRSKRTLQTLVRDCDA